MGKLPTKEIVLVGLIVLFIIPKIHFLLMIFSNFTKIDLGIACPNYGS